MMNENFSLQMNILGLFFIQMPGGYITNSGVQLPLSKWNIITVTLTLLESYSGTNLHQIVFASVYVNNQIVIFTNIPYLTPPSFLQNDNWIIGGPNGFIGQVANFRIYSPGSGYLQDKGN